MYFPRRASRDCAALNGPDAYDGDERQQRCARGKPVDIVRVSARNVERDQRRLHAAKFARPQPRRLRQLAAHRARSGSNTTGRSPSPPTRSKSTGLPTTRAFASPKPPALNIGMAAISSKSLTPPSVFSPTASMSPPSPKSPRPASASKWIPTLPSPPASSNGKSMTPANPLPFPPSPKPASNAPSSATVPPSSTAK